tara:strand:- start:5705 stop:6007 length:303 start_codon:yes stop_codon:yes gene_type:complete
MAISKPNLNEWARVQMQRVVKSSGLSTKEYARRELLREPTTLYRWISGESPIPLVVTTWLLENCQIENPPSEEDDASDYERVMALLTELESLAKEEKESG